MWHYHLSAALAGRRQFDPATRHAREAVRLLPNSGPARLQLAQLLMRGDDFDEAAEQLLEALRLEPGDAKIRALASETLARARREGKSAIAKRLESRLSTQPR
jgi:predicted Zn-dependent protease